ncbi:MAG: hypothetical protein GX153_07330 [Clostridiaceae bacterium]|jgi:hypothetical protein|nr:hypothetical protein [Clostridiaceae bacterium]
MEEPDRRNIGVGSSSVSLTDDDGSVLYEGRIYGLPLREKAILQKSIEFFNDPDPCYKHRGAVHVRMWNDIEKHLVQTGSRSVRFNSLPEEFREWIDMDMRVEQKP